jgi:hypothetical protein
MNHHWTTKHEALGNIAEMCGDMTTDNEAEAMFNLLIAKNLMTSHHDGYRLADIDDSQWFSLHGEMMAAQEAAR